MKHLCLEILFVLFPLLAFAQSDFFSTDTTFVGIDLIDGGDLLNSRICRVNKDNKTIEYSPYDVEEFGFADGRVYISKEIRISDSTKKVFLEIIQDGKITLYYYRGIRTKLFFIEKDSSIFIEISNRPTNDILFHEQLYSILNDCSGITDAIEFVKYNKNSLSKLINRYNYCLIKPFPHIKYGLAFGYEFSRLVPPKFNLNENIKYFDFKYNGGFTTGIFIDNPILLSDFSLHTEVFFSKHGYSYNKTVDNIDFDLVANFSSFKVPLSIRYAYPSNNIRPFINLGIVGSFNIRNEIRYCETIITNNIIELNESKSLSLINDIQLGYCIGGGFEFKLNPKHSLFFELSYNNQNAAASTNTFKISEYKFLTGINF